MTHSRPRHVLSAPRIHAGFTLIEIMIAVVILGILVSISLPFYEGYITEARIDTAIKDIRQMEVILNDRFTDNDPPATLAAAGISLTDPWGNPYQYLWLRNNPAHGLNGARRRDKSMNPVNTDYDLFSLGPNGKSQPELTGKLSLDDVIRANNGAFYGQAKDY